MTGQILIVEDEEHLARGLKFNLEAEGYKTRVAGDGETALDLLLNQRLPFDLLVLDVMLPGKDGFAVATELRKANHYIPLLMLTARGRPEDVLDGFAAGADDYLPKPFDLNILLARIQSLLRRREWSRTLVSDPPNESRVAEPKAADSLREFDVYSFAGKQVDFGTLELRSPSLLARVKSLPGEWRFFAFTDTGWLKVSNPLPEQKNHFDFLSWGLGSRVRLLDHFDGTIAASMPVLQVGKTKAQDWRILFKAALDY